MYMRHVSLYLHVPVEGSLLPKYRDCTTSNNFELYIYIYTNTYIQMLVKTGISTTPTITGNKKCMKSRCQICNIIDTRPSLKIPGTYITVRPGNYYCNSSNVIYLIKCKKCDSGNYIGETSTFFRLRKNNHKKSIRDNNKGLPVARHFNVPGYSICDLECVILKGDFSNNVDRLIEEQTLIRKFKTDPHGLNQDIDFLAPYTYFHK